MSLRLDEYLTLAAMGYWLVLAAARRPPRGGRIGMVAVATATLVVALGGAPHQPFITVLRNWLPSVYVLVMYWLSGQFFVGPQPRVEAILESFDRSLLRWAAPLLAAAPRALLECLELAYLSCAILVPGGFVVLVAAGACDRAEYYWSAVLLAAFGAFGALPWIQTRPPRLIEPPGPLDLRPVLTRRINALVTRYATIQVNTVPSGHAASATAIALAMWHVVPAAGPIFTIVAAGIIAGSVLGRYHYALDAISGIAVGLLAWSIVSLAGI